MGLGKVGSSPQFQYHAQGIIGEFRTPAGRVNYLMTKARLGEDATDPERRLTQHLVPFREVIPPEELDFNQLLQRDLDDHRVAVNLIPYILNPESTGPAFFPPIVAIALPFQQQRPSEFPELDAPTQVTEDGMTWRQQDAGNFLRIRKFLDDDGNDSPIPLGQLWWNGEYSRIIVVDGQHRAMSLLAIDRTMRKTWQESTGSRYRYFYESRITEQLKRRKDKDQPIEDIEVPVTLLWFPDMFGPDGNPHQAARKIFVDVNKEARTPSESRLILLSDTELINIFTRTTLSQLRNETSGTQLPLYCVEYDNPDTKTTQSARWSALTNIHALKQMITRSVFGPPRYINKIADQWGGRESESEKDAFMRTQLQIDELFPPEIDGKPLFKRDNLGNTNFPEAAIPTLKKAYENSWSTALLILLSDIHPYQAHIKALEKLKTNWLTDDSISTLSHDALFSGVGMYWTLRDSAQHWEEDAGRKKDGKPDIVKAWDIISAKQLEFEKYRAHELLGSEDRRDQANQVYAAMNTHACQVGLAVTLATINRRALVKSEHIENTARSMTSAINAWMLSQTTGVYDRRTALAKRKADWPKNPLNTITNMDMPRAVQFRYFWLEILCSTESLEYLKDIINLDELGQLRDEGRAAYIRYIAGEKQRALRTSNPELTDVQRKEQSITQSAKELRIALMKWFGMSAEQGDAIFTNAIAESEPSPTIIEEAEEVEEL